MLFVRNFIPPWAKSEPVVPVSNGADKKQSRVRKSKINSDYIKELSSVSLGNYFNELKRELDDSPNLKTYRQMTVAELSRKQDFPNLLNKDQDLETLFKNNSEEEIFYSLINYTDPYYKSTGVLERNFPIDEKENKLVKEIFDRGYFDRGLLADAKRNAYFNSGCLKADNLELYTIYKAIKEFSDSGKLQDIDLQKIIDRNIFEEDGMKKSKKKFSLSIDTNQTSFSGFGFTDMRMANSSKSWCERRFKDKEYMLGVDAPLSLILHYKDEPVAQLGFSFYPAKNAICINQLQLIKYFKVGENDEVDAESKFHGVTGNLDTQKVLVESLEELAAKNGFSRVYMQSAENNFWTWNVAPREEKPHLDTALAKEIYNKTANDLHFTETNDYSAKAFSGFYPNFVKELQLKS